jgi:hypothetical protein
VPLKDGFALFDEGLGGLLVVGGLARARMMDRLASKQASSDRCSALLMLRLM